MTPAMHRSRAALSLASLSLTLLLGSAGAQNLDAYRSMASALDRAVSDRPSDKAASLRDLDAATTAYTTLKEGLSSSLLVGGIDRSLTSARAALSRTPADLEAQVVQVRSLMRKALHDQTLSLIAAAPQSAAVQAGLLATEFGLSGQNRTDFLKVVAQGQTDRVARLLRLAAARKIQASLANAAVPQNNTQRTQTYLALARATGWFTVVQDAPNTGGLTVGEFGTALKQLTSTPTDPGLGGSLRTLQQDAAAFVRASAQTSSAASTQTTTTASTQTAGTQSTGTQTTGTQTTGTQTAAQPAKVPPTIPATSASTSPADAATTPRTGNGASAGSTDALYAALGRALSDAGHADTVAARRELSRASGLLAGSPLSAANGFSTLAADLSALQERSGLRASDVQAVIAELSGLETPAQASALDETSAGVSRTLGAPVMPLLFLLVGLLALYPLYLLNLAFGGRNGYWRTIAAALGLLFLPALLEGLSGTLLYLGDASGLGALRSLGNLSLHQGAWALPLWLVLSALSVGLASYGFRGLCRQFGLLGSGSSRSAGARAARDPQQSALDWDEEL
ncbi:hypothetical protein MF271_12500 [Deinococcus sp. KNUC1210]|uniref:hypothetical protein n=1 Tax=Deinococcus sp. KNUC1210 TaxID=2917691 RepID=UPI001EF09C80|nr:hypothetical protein [Deinococcus sp. KNUC1210]ULH14799.1 hypothetical protein MF271_12500 [Deinococcus sp. KNUC1210]